MKYTFEIIWISWLLSEIFLNRLLRSKNINAKVLDRNSLNLIWIAIVVSMTMGILCAIYWAVPLGSFQCFALYRINTYSYRDEH
jgi:hypothetical protein